MTVEAETVAGNETFVVANDEEPVKTDKEVIAEEERDEEKEDEGIKEEIIEDKKIVKEKKKTVLHKKDFEKYVVYLFQFNRSSEIPSISPLCLQVESWLKLHGIKFENVDLKTKLWSKEGKLLPFIELSGDRVTQADIFETLALKFEKEIDSFLDEDQKKVKDELSELVESRLYMSIVHWRSLDPENLVKGYKMAVPTALGAPLPPPAVKVYFNYTYCKKGLKMVKTSQVGSSNKQEIESIGKDVLKKLSEKLGEQKFFFGDEVSSLDLAVFSHVAQVAMVDKEHPCALREFLENECNNLLELIERVKEKVWGEDWAKATGDKLHMNPHLVVEDEKEQDCGIKRNRGGTLSRIRGALHKKKNANEKRIEADDEKEDETEKVEESEDLLEKESTLTRMMSVFKKKKQYASYTIQSKKTEEDSEDSKKTEEDSEDSKKTEEDSEDKVEKEEDEGFTEEQLGDTKTSEVEKPEDEENAKEETFTEAKKFATDIVNEIASTVKEDTFPEAKEIITDIVNEVAKAKARDCTKESEEL